LLSRGAHGKTAALKSAALHFVDPALSTRNDVMDFDVDGGLNKRKMVEENHDLAGFAP